MAFNTTPENKDGAQRRRLFRRFQSPAAATANPFPRPRDEHGDTRQRKYTYDGTIPARGALLTQHGRSLDLIARYRPLRAALLRDIIERVDAATDRHAAIVQEEETALQFFNEDAANAQAVVQSQIDTLNDARTAREGLEDDRCAGCREELAEARSDYAATRARAGLPVSLIELRGATLDDEAEMWGGADAAALTDAAIGGLGTLADGVARAAEAKAAAVIGVAGAAPGAIREGGNILARLFGKRILRNGQAPAPESPDSEASDVSPVTQVASAPFSLEAARQQAKPAEVHAHESGYPASSAAARIAGSHWLPDFLALLTCGAIFGSSIGLLLGYIDPDAMQVAAGRQIAVWGVCSVFGVALFYVLGCTSEAIFALVSEQYHAALVATHRSEPSAVGRWLRRAAGWTAGVAVAVFALLIGIEAVVERYGIVQLAISRMSDALMLGHGATPKADLQGLPATMIALIASVPFMCYHAVKGWTHARLSVLKEAMEAGHVQEAWDIASREYGGVQRAGLPRPDAATERHEDTTILPLGDFRLSGAPSANGNGTAPAGATGPHVAVDQGRDGSGCAETHSPSEAATAVLPGMGERARLPETEEAPTVVTVMPVKEATPAMPHQPIPTALMEELARANERLREAFIRLREAYKGRRETLQPFDTQIGQLQAMIVQERLEMPLEAKRRIEDAYADVIGAVQTFDKMYQDELKVVERLMRGGFFVRLRDWLFRPAA